MTLDDGVRHRLAIDVDDTSRDRELSRAVQDEPTEGHLAGGEGPGLGAADDVRRAQRLDGREPPHERLLVDQPLDRQGEADRDDRRERLRDDRDGEGDAPDEHLEDREALDDPQERDQSGQDEGADAQDAPEVVEVPLERRPVGLLAREELGDPTELRLVGRRDDDRPGAPVDGGRARMCHVRPVGDREVLVRDRRGGLLDRRRLARQDLLVGPELPHLEEPAVGRDDLAGRERDEVALHDLVTGDRDLPTAPDDEGPGGRELPEFLHRRLGLPLLQEAQEGRQDHDDHDRRALDVFARRERDDRRRDQDPDQGIDELLEEEPPPGIALLLLELVRSVAFEAAARLLGSEAVRAGVDGAEDIVGSELVPAAGVHEARIYELDSRGARGSRSHAPGRHLRAAGRSSSFRGRCRRRVNLAPPRRPRTGRS